MSSEKITVEMIKQLRDRTNVGMDKCKRALEEASGDMEKAIDILRKAGFASAVKKEGRETKEGIIAYAETKEAIAFVELNAETDFVVKNDKFRNFADQIAAQAAREKPASLETFLALRSDQDTSVTIDEFRSLMIQAIGENIRIKRVEIFSKSSKTSLGIYSHMSGKIVTLVELEGDAHHEALAKEIAMHVAAESPDYLKPEDVPADVRAREEEVVREQVKGKPANVIDQIVKGKLQAFYAQACLLNQKYIKDNNLTIQELLDQAAKKSGHSLVLKRFVYWKVGQ
jgi:elongation factor Ts